MFAYFLEKLNALTPVYFMQESGKSKHRTAIINILIYKMSEGAKNKINMFFH